MSSFSPVVLYALSAVYFAGVMVRLMLTLTPVVCILASIAISKTLNEYLVDEAPKKTQSADEEDEDEEEEADRKNRKYYDKVSLSTPGGCFTKIYANHKRVARKYIVAHKVIQGSHS